MDNQISEIYENNSELIPSGIIITDENSNILYTNSEALTISNLYNLSLSTLIKPIQKNSTCPKLSIVTLQEKTYIIHSESITIFNKKVILYDIFDYSINIKTENELYIYHCFLDSISNYGMLAVDAKKKIIYYNNISAKYDNLQQDYVLGKDFESVFPDTENSAVLKALSTKKPALDHEMFYETPNNKKVNVLSSAYPVKRNGEIIGAFSITRFNDSLRTLLQNTFKLQEELFAKQTKKANGTNYTFSNIIGGSDAIKLVIKNAQKATFSPATVLIYGETGTGKELFAQSIHNAGSLKNKPFVAINCAAIPDTLLESTLFGTTKGSFTGAVSTPGLFEQAQDGTLFLDEINSMPMALQAKLLRVLQEKAFRRIGGNTEIPVRCRIISSCNKTPLDCVKNGTIRSDLYYRLSVICIEIPPLREREEDVFLLANFFINKYSSIYGVNPIMTEEFKQALRDYTWPGNVRELQHTIERAIILLEPDDKLSVKYLPNNIRSIYKERSSQEKIISNYICDEQSNENMSYDNLKIKLLKLERESILSALQDNNWNISNTAKVIGYTRSNLQYRMKKLGIAQDESTFD